MFSSGTAGDPLGVMQTDGNFVVYGARGPAALFQIRTAGNPGARLVVQDDGNVVVYTPRGKALFSTR